MGPCAHDHLDEYERWARERMTPVLGPLRVTDCPRGPNGRHDFEADLSGRLIAAIEVTSEVDSRRLEMGSAVEQKLSSMKVPGSALTWVVGLSEKANVKGVRANLAGVLGDLETAGITYAHDLGRHDDPTQNRLRSLRIESVIARKARPGKEGTVVVSPGSYGGWGWDGSTIDAWLHDLLTSERGVNKLGKLERARSAAERHLVIVLDPFSPAGVGIPLALSARHDRGAAEFGIPSSVPSAPITHLWIIPAMVTWEGLAWSSQNGWTALDAWRPA